MSPKDTQQSADSTAESGKGYVGFTEEERAAMKARLKEQKAAARRGAEAEDGENEVLAKIAEMTGKDRALGERLHALIKASDSSLSPKLWYGMPAYYKNGKLVCHFQCAQKFKMRYAILGFSDNANLDEGDFWPVAYAVNELTAAEEARISALVKKAVS